MIFPQRERAQITAPVEFLRAELRKYGWRIIWAGEGNFFRLSNEFLNGTLLIEFFCGWGYGNSAADWRVDTDSPNERLNLTARTALEMACDAYDYSY